MTIKTKRTKAAVIGSLESIASFNGDAFKFPIRVFGAKLVVKPRYVIGDGFVKNDDGLTFVKVNLRPSGGSVVSAALFTVVSILTAIIGVTGLVSGNIVILHFFALVFISLIFFTLPRIIYFFAIQLKKDSIENLVLHSN